jgi:ubiquinone/menaquinone biosynthesis C-methylase UbiE
LILDVGSGSLPEHIAFGSVNIDKIKPPEPPENFVQADARYLPFKNGCFHEVSSRHCLEHIPEPMRVLAEMKRACKVHGRITVAVPHRFVLREHDSSHVNKFCAKWFQKALKLLDLELLGFETHYGLFGLPREIIVKAKKPWK